MNYGGLLLLVILLFRCSIDIPKEMLHEISKLPEDIDYNFHVKPILSDKCFACHGPDSNKRKANLRLDFDQNLLANSDVKTFKDVKSEIPNRLLSSDSEVVMPPPESHLELTDHEIATILKWIDQGGEYKPHWSFLTPSNSPVRTIKTDLWDENEIDFFDVPIPHFELAANQELN